MRFAILFLMLMPAMLRADEATLRAKAALALTVSAEPDLRAKAALALSVAECGQCLPEPVARAQARQSGCPVVLFVGGCDGVAKDLADTGAVFARTASYDHDGRPATEKRAVVLTPKGVDGWVVEVTVSEPVTAARVSAVIPRQVSESVAPVPTVVPKQMAPAVDWCPTGQCPLRK